MLLDTLIQLHPDLWVVKKLFHLGEGQERGLQWEGLRERFLEGLKLDENEPVYKAKIFSQPNESPQEYLNEEIQMTRKVLQNDAYVPFPLDTTMTVVRFRSANGQDGPQVALHSPVPYDKELAFKIEQIAPVSVIICPNLQHWLFATQWVEHYPLAKVYIPPAAFGEDVREKLKLDRNVITLQNGTQISPELQQRFLAGAPLNMNECLFFHSPSGTLIASDGFYGGYASVEDTTWFSRAWFKLTKGQFSGANLPIYRTCRVLSHGDKHALMRSVRSIVEDWKFTQIIGAHGSVPFRAEDCPSAFEKAWSVVLN